MSPETAAAWIGVLFLAALALLIIAALTGVLWSFYRDEPKDNPEKRDVGGWGT